MTLFSLLELAATNNVAVAAHERRGGRLKHNGHGGRVDLDGIKLHGVLGIGIDVANIGVVNAHHGRDVARLCLAALLASQVVKGEELLDLAHLAAAVVLNHKDLVAGVDGARVNAANANATHVVGVVNGHALHGQRPLEVHVGRGHGVDDHVKQRVHVHVAIVGVEARKAVDGRGVHHVLHGKLKFLVGGAQVHHEVEAVVQGLLGVGAVAVDLVDDNHDRQMRGNGVREDKARLGHGALRRVNQQQRAIGHLEHALHLAAKVGVARGVDDVDLDALVLDGDVLGQDGDASLTLLVIGVKHALLDLLVLAEGVGSLEHLVNQRGLAVVDVGNDCDVSNLLLEHGHLSSSSPAYIRQR